MENRTNDEAMSLMRLIRHLKNKNKDTTAQDKTKGSEKEKLDLAALAQSPYKRLEHSREAELILADDSVIQFVRIEGTGASSVSLEEQDLIIRYFYTFLSKNKDHFFTEITQFPVNTAPQRNHLKSRLRKLQTSRPKTERQAKQLSLLEDKLRAKIKRFEALEEDLTNSEYIGWFYAENKKEMSKLVRRFAQMAATYRLSLSPLTRREKEQILFQLNNPNTKL
ncbi:hypothetical protein VNN41_09990 [Lactococcus garvieae]|uniref:hypothetical protein n=1 Tax=Lactococcus garvieae TaxID=1363 RepID=UPI003254B9A8